MERSKAVDSFQENPKISVAILSITAAGTGNIKSSYIYNLLSV